MTNYSDVNKAARYNAKTRTNAFGFKAKAKATDFGFKAKANACTNTDSFRLSVLAMRYL